MNYTKRIWKDLQGTNLIKFAKFNESSSTVELVRTPDLVTQEETPVTADAMNNIENAIEELYNIICPVGSIVARVSGYFTDASNYIYTDVKLSLSDNWKVCDGSECYDANSPIFNITGRFLPNLTDSRFIMGSTIAGSIGGNANNSVTLAVHHLAKHTHNFAHNHAFSGSTDYTNPVHCHSPIGGGSFYGNAGGSTGSGLKGDTSNCKTSATTNEVGVNHLHLFSGTTQNNTNITTDVTGSGTAFSILPKYLSAIYIMRIK